MLLLIKRRHHYHSLTSVSFPSTHPPSLSHCQFP